MTDHAPSGIPPSTRARTPGGDVRDLESDPSVSAGSASTRSPLTLEAVYREHAAFVWRIARRFGVLDAELDDTMHEVFLVVQRRLHEYDGRAAVTTWLYMLTRGVCSNHMRGRRRAQRRLRAVEREPQQSAPDDPERVAQTREAAEFVRRFLTGLDVDKRLIFELVELEGHSVTEVARAVQIPVNTAYSRLRAARAAFHSAVAHQQAKQAQETG